MRRRQTLTAAAIGAALLIAGCSSTSGTASSSSSPSSAGSAAVSPSASSSASMRMLPPSGSPSARQSSAPTSSPSASRSARSASSSGSSADTGTVAAGGDSPGSSSSLDAESTRWFDTLCTGFLPLTDLSKLGDTVSAAKDIKTAQQQVVTLFAKAGASFTNTATSLKGLPAPTVQGGAETATKFEPVLTKLGSTLTDAARKVAAVEVTKNPADLETVLTDTAKQVSSMSSSVNLDSVTTSPGAEKAIESIPSCRQLSQLGT